MEFEFRDLGNSLHRQYIVSDGGGWVGFLERWNAGAWRVGDLCLGLYPFTASDLRQIADRLDELNRANCGRQEPRKEK